MSAPILHHWTTPDGLVFPYREWCHPAPRAVAIAVHGLSGASTDFEPLVDCLLERGFLIYAPDLRSQGNDPREHHRGDLADHRELITDLIAFTRRIRGQHPGLPVLCYAESMGSLILLASRTHPDAPDLQGLVLASPVVELREKLSWWKLSLAWLAIVLLPGKRVGAENYVDPNVPKPRVTRDPEMEKLIDSAPHALRRFTLRFFGALLRLMSAANTAAPRITEPVLVLHGGQDIFVTTEAVERFTATLGSRDVTRRLFPDAYHLLLCDHDKEHVLAALAEWLDARFA